MNLFGKTAGTILFTGALLATLVSCKKPEGPAETAGKEVDKTTEKAGQQVEKAGENIQDAAKGDKK